MDSATSIGESGPIVALFIAQSSCFAAYFCAEHAMVENAMQ
jgi:hypothetical protein